MIHAYDKLYLSKAQVSLGSMLDFAVYDLKISLEDFYNSFLFSEFSKQFERGEASVIAGKSGVELALEITRDFSKKTDYRPSANRSEEYWAGWALAYFQWNTNLTFREINSFIPVTEILSMYNPYHEMDITQFCEHMEELFNSRNPVSNLKRLRLNAKLSQSQLSKISGIPLKTIQQYEQKQKNIAAAKAETVIILSKILSCSVEDLMNL